MVKPLVYLLGFSLCLINARAKGDVYTTGVTLSLPGSIGSIAAWTQPNLGGDGAIVLLEIEDNFVLRPTAYSIGIGHAWYRVTAGTAIDPAFTMTAPAFVNAFTGDLSGRIQLTLGQTYLLGFWLDANGNGQPGLGDRFGWARATYTVSGLILTNSAIESTGTGIIAGTTAVVPEPSIACLLFSALAAMMCVSFGYRRQALPPSAFRNPKSAFS